MDNNDDETIVLNYHDTLLRNEDVDTLRGTHWLDDAVIGFYFEYLQYNHDENNENRDILFISPELTQLLKMSDVADYSESLEPLNAKQYSYILFPLNDCESRNAAGGSHWSLLAYSKNEQTTFHLDSCSGTNRLAATQFAKKIMDYLLETGAKEFKELQCPQQENGYDCGPFVLCLADIILKKIGTAPGIRDCSFDDVLSAVRTKREKLLDLIQELINSQDSENKIV